MKLKDYDDFDEELLEEDQKEPEQKKDGEREPSGEREAKYLEAKGTFEKDTGKTGVLKVFLTLFCCLVILIVLLTGAMIVYSRTIGRESDIEENVTPVVSGTIVYTQEEVDAKIAQAASDALIQGRNQVLLDLKGGLLDGVTVVELLRELYPDDIVVAAGGKYHFVPVNRELKMNSLDPINLNVLDNGEFQYLTDGKVTSYKGIDVSSHQGVIDWNLVAQDGVEFAFIRVGFRGYGSEGKLVVDEMFHTNIQQAKEAGVKVGVYMFSQATTEAELDEEVQLVLDNIASYQLDCPVVYDVEMISGNGRMNNLTPEERTNLTLRFCEKIAQAGYRPMIYHNTEMAAIRIDYAALEAYDKWYAAYNRRMFFPYEFKVWQYSDKGSVQGIKTNVDMNISFAPLWE
ncbi:MAG: glycoside hydrolase family 25 protein [Acetatifactor sp.]|nr:glycoside hydrolase family 25 protein [Acetatifactor sp.]